MEEHDSDVTALTRPSEAILQTWIGLGTGYARKLVQTSFTAARDVHGEWKARLKDVFDTVESTQQGFTSLTRRLVGHVDAVIEDTLSTSQQGVEALVNTVGTAADEAANGAARTSSIWIGPGKARKTG
ncbi:MAG: hypothetical protein AAF799_24825 [Myxococcota bacterium]